MKLHADCVPGVHVVHELHGEMDDLLQEVILGGRVLAALGPVYQEDPARDVLEPFRRSQRESRWSALDDQGLAPAWALESACKQRSDLVRYLVDESLPSELDAMVQWTRAGMVLELGSLHGVKTSDGVLHHPRWKLRGTVTTRFGIEHTDGFNPLTIPRQMRDRVVPRHPVGSICVIDFKAMDLCSMRSLLPDLEELYRGCDDSHARTAEILGVDREVAKRELFVHCYGGRSELHDLFRKRMPQLDVCLKLNEAQHGATAQVVQRTSAEAFRAALSRALLSLFDPWCIPIFAVHDELVLDLHPEGTAKYFTDPIAADMRQGASDRLGVRCDVGISFGRNYALAKQT